jgi:hypothetical protein
MTMISLFKSIRTTKNARCRILVGQFQACRKAKRPRNLPGATRSPLTTTSDRLAPFFANPKAELNKLFRQIATEMYPKMMYESLGIAKKMKTLPADKLAVDGDYQLWRLFRSYWYRYTNHASA